MDFGQRIVKEVVTTTERDDGILFAVVRFDDGEYGISQNGQLIRAYVWPEEDADICEQTMLKLAGHHLLAQH